MGFDPIIVMVFSVILIYFFYDPPFIMIFVNLL